MFFGCRGYPASIWHKYPGKWYHCSRTVAGCWSWYKQSCVGGVLLEESRKPVRFYEIFLHQQLLLSFITACSLLPSTCNKQIRPCSFSVHAFLNAIYAIFYNCSEGVECNDAVSVTLWIMFIIVIALSRFDEKLPLVLQSAAILIKFLYNMVLDTFDRYRYMFFVVYFYKKITTCVLWKLLNVSMFS